MASINDILQDDFDYGSQSALSSETQNIVVVDDEVEIISVLEEFLNNLGYENRKAQNGLEALELLREKPATIIITDLIMPEMGGMELIHKVKEKWPETDLIVMTGYTKEFKYTDVIKAEASDFIQKPFNLDELEAKLNRIIRERNLKATLKKLAIKDGLTGLYNRHMFEERVEAETEKSDRLKYNLYLIMLDVDKLKKVNDTLGHQVGDKVLRTVAKVIRNSTRHNVDIAFRYGGDEFTILLPSTKAFQVKEIAERIRKNFLLEEIYGTSLCLGISQFINKSIAHRKNIDLFIKTADDALYEAKKLGRNKVIIATSAKETHLEINPSQSKDKEAFPRS